MQENMIVIKLIKHISLVLLRLRWVLHIIITPICPNKYVPILDEAYLIMLCK